MQKQRTGDPRSESFDSAWRIVPWLASIGVVLYWIVLGNRYSMWYDEAFSSRQSTLTLVGLADSLLSKEANLGPYYIVLWVWEKAFPGPWLARGLSAIGTLLTVHGIWHLVRRHYDDVVAAGAIVVFVTNPFVLRWTLQMRGHTLVMAATVWGLVCASDMLRRLDHRSAILFGILTGLSCATMLSSIPLHIGVFVAVFVAQPSRLMLRRLALAALMAVTTFTPFVPAFIARRDQINWVPPLDMDRFLEESVIAIGGLPTTIVYGFALCVLCIAAVLDRRSRKSLALVVIALWGFIGLVLISLFIQPMYVDRYLVASIPLLCMGIIGAATAFEGRRRTLSVAGLAACCLVVSAVWRSHVLPPNHDFRWAISEIESHGRQGDAVLTIPFYQLITLQENWGEGQETFFVLNRFPKSGKPVRVEGGDVVEPQRLWVVGFLEDEWRDVDRRDAEFLETLYPLLIERWDRGPLSVQLWSQ